ncbi:MAG: hypothetical protein ACYTGC_07210, partial [Planctomycetota bacterium]
MNATSRLLTTCTAVCVASIVDVSVAQNSCERDALLASDGAVGDAFGGHVAIFDELAVVGAGGDDDFTGSAYIYRFDRSNSGWVQEQKLVPVDGAVGDFFGGGPGGGSAVAIVGDTAMVGAPMRDLVGGPGADLEHAGAVFVFRYDAESETWIQVQQLVASDAAAGDFFGQSISMSGDLAVIGADACSACNGGGDGF